MKFFWHPLLCKNNFLGPFQYPQLSFLPCFPQTLNPSAFVMFPMHFCPQCPLTLYLAPLRLQPSTSWCLLLLKKKYCMSNLVHLMFPLYFFDTLSLFVVIPFWHFHLSLALHFILFWLSLALFKCVFVIDRVKVIFEQKCHINLKFY